MGEGRTLRTRCVIRRLVGTAQRARGSLPVHPVSRSPINLADLEAALSVRRDFKMAQQFVQAKITGDKVVVFLKPTCPYCVMAKKVLSEYKFKPGHLECVDISGHSDMDKIQDFLRELTGARTVNAAFLWL